MNDSKADPAGRFWAGTRALDTRAGAGALYRLDAEHNVQLMVSGVSISNGLGWSPRRPAGGSGAAYSRVPHAALEALRTRCSATTPRPTMLAVANPCQRMMAPTAAPGARPIDISRSVPPASRLPT